MGALSNFSPVDGSIFTCSLWNKTADVQYSEHSIDSVHGWKNIRLLDTYPQKCTKNEKAFYWTFSNSLL